MNSGDRFGRDNMLDLAALAGRWVLGGVFLYMGLNKAWHPVEFLKLVRQYDAVTNSFLLNSIAAALPWFEFFCGLLLVAGIAVRGTALTLVLMLVPFTLLILRRALAVSALHSLPLCAVKFDCGCGSGEVLICHKLLENSLLIVLAGWLSFHPRAWLCLKFRLGNKPLVATASLEKADPTAHQAAPR